LPKKEEEAHKIYSSPNSKQEANTGKRPTSGLKFNRGFKIKNEMKDSHKTTKPKEINNEEQPNFHKHTNIETAKWIEIPPLKTSTVTTKLH
jgi:hypothetical protein